MRILLSARASVSGSAASVLAALVLVIFAPLAGGPPARAQSHPDAPRNDYPDPYRTINDWAKLPAGRAWGSVGGVGVDSHNNIWVAERCGANTCAGSDLDPILEFSPSGKLLISFGAGMFVFPHGLAVDTRGRVWVSDGQGKDGKGQQVFEFSPDGKVPMTLGKAGVAGSGPDEFHNPSAVAIAPNGDIFV
ncbi:MAG: hypothetical protein ACRD4Y_10355, partial [Candidatus Acidiferrales bacterium]